MGPFFITPVLRWWLTFPQVGFAPTGYYAFCSAHPCFYCYIRLNLLSLLPMLAYLDTLILTCFDKKKHLFKVIIRHLAVSHKFKFVDDLYQNVRNVGFKFTIWYLFLIWCFGFGIHSQSLNRFTIFTAASTALFA
jgi:hypothetical protein